MPTKKDDKAESTKMERAPAVVMDATPKVDRTACKCEDVTRRWDTDGYLGEVDGVRRYQCSSCGKWYSA